MAVWNVKGCSFKYLQRPFSNATHQRYFNIGTIILNLLWINHRVALIWWNYTLCIIQIFPCFLHTLQSIRLIIDIENGQWWIVLLPLAASFCTVDMIILWNKDVDLTQKMVLKKSKTFWPTISKKEMNGFSWITFQLTWIHRTLDLLDSGLDWSSRFWVIDRIKIRIKIVSDDFSRTNWWIWPNLVPIVTVLQTCKLTDFLDRWGQWFLSYWLDKESDKNCNWWFLENQFTDATKFGVNPHSFSKLKTH